MSDTNAQNGSVLVPAGIHTATCQTLRSLGRKGLRPIVATEDDSIPELGSRYCAEWLRVPSPNEDFEAYRDALLDVVERREISTIVPCREEDAYLLSNEYDAFAEHVSLVVPPMEALEAVHDRLQLAEVAAAAGVPAPETERLDAITNWDARHIVKSRYNLLTSEYLDSRSGESPEEVKTVTHLQPGTAPDRSRLRSEMKHDPIVQEFVPYDDEYMFAALYDRGEPLATFQHKQIRGDSYTGGGGVYRESVYVQELEDVARRLLDHLDWHGFACIEYMKDERTGEFVLTEINPRLWQSLPATVRSGADFPYYYWLAATGQPDRIDPEYDLGIGSHMLYGELKYLLSILKDDSPHVEKPRIRRELWDILRSCYQQPHADYLHLDDPYPFVRGVRSFLKSD